MPLFSAAHEPLHVLFVTDAPAVGGSEIYLRELIGPMRQHGVVAAVALPARPETADFRAQLLERAIPVYAYHSLSEVAQLQRRTRPDLIALSSWNALGYRKYYAVLQGPFVAVVHDQLMLHIPGLPQGMYRAGYELAQAGDIRAAEHVVTVSFWAAEYLRQYHHMQQVYAVPNGVDTQKFRPAEGAERETLRRDYGFTRFTVLNAARMSLEKNHFAVLATARAAPELDFVLVGTGYLEATLRRLAPPNVRFLGKRQDMPQLYRAADVALQPTIAENQSLATLEALSSGLPVVTNDIPAQREIVSFGNNGFLIHSGAPGYARVLRLLAQRPALRNSMAQQARQSVLAAHTLEQNAAALANVFKTIAAQAPRQTT